jgi:hypothetical protein
MSFCLGLWYPAGGAARGSYRYGTSPYRKTFPGPAATFPGGYPHRLARAIIEVSGDAAVAPRDMEDPA